MYIHETEIREFLYEKLIEKGLVPSEDEICILAEIIFDYLVELDILEDEEDDD